MPLIQSTEPEPTISNKTRFKAIAGAALTETLCFHPSDTIQKRLMRNPKAIYDLHLPMRTNLINNFNICFRNQKTNNISLYPGIGWALGYKLTQRIYKFNGQPIIEKGLNNYVFNNQNNVWCAGLSGALIGMGEIILLPLDIYKIRKQTASIDKGISYRGTGITMARNGCGSFALFAIPPFMTTLLEQHEQPNTAMTKGVASAIGAVSMLMVSSPFDVVKTRMNADKSAGSGFNIAKKILLDNPAAFFKGITPKLATKGVQMTAFLVIKDALVEHFHREETTTGQRPSK